LDLLKSCPPLAALSPAELEAVARASRPVVCDPEQRPFFSRANTKGHVYILEAGKVAVSVSLRADARCGGQAKVLLDHKGQAFGWSALVRADRLRTRPRCVARTRMIEVDLKRLSPALRLKVFKRVTVYLYAVLQDLGLCPFNLKGLVRLSSEPAR
jgi:hypothetical protein